MCGADALCGQLPVGVMLAAHVLASGRCVTSQPPAAVNLAVMPPVHGEQAADDRHLAEVRPEPGPEPVPAARNIINAQDMQQPVQGQ